MKVFKLNAKSIVASLALVFCAGVSASAQVSPTPTPTLLVSNADKDLPIAARNNLYCSGYIQTAPLNTDNQIVGADDEAEQNVYTQGDLVYVNRGASSGAQVGDRFSVVRPRGKFDTKSAKRGSLGFYVQEVGALEIVRVKSNVSLARIVSSCDNFLLGDLLQPMDSRVSPMFSSRPALDTFAEATGKATGRIVLARDGRELLAREQVVYIDLGAEDSVRVGDYLTIFRPLGTGGVKNIKVDDFVAGTRKDYGSDAYRGGPFSNQAPRKSGSTADGDIVKPSEVKKNRPANLRKVVGEMVIINVRERTATAIITRNASEIHTNDLVEVQ